MLIEVKISKRIYFSLDSADFILSLNANIGQLLGEFCFGAKYGLVLKALKRSMNH